MERLLLKHRIPIYRERADTYRRRATLTSLRQGIHDHAENAVEGAELIEAIPTRAVTLPGQQQPIHFAIDRRGLAFARVEGSKVYPIDTTSSEGLLKVAEYFDSCANSFWKRLRHEGFERQYGSVFTDLTMALERTTDVYTKIIFDLDELNRSLRDK